MHEVFIPLTKDTSRLLMEKTIPKSEGLAGTSKFLNGKPYAARSEYLPEAWKKRAASHARTILMSVSLLGPKKGEEVDHINRDTLDNRRKNLRVGTKPQNLWNQKIRSTNTSGFKGVDWKQWENSGAWCARLSHNSKRVHIGYFKTAEEAARAYDQKAKELFGEFARLNFPEKEMVGGL
jgi:hypothetical protein